MSFHVVIPARYASQRLPAKPLADIAGKPMVVRVVERAQLSRAASVVGPRITPTSPRRCAPTPPRGADPRGPSLRHRPHRRGADLSGWSEEDIVVNVQGDEPLIEPELIRRVAHELSLDAEAAIATASHAITEAADFSIPMW